MRYLLSFICSKSDLVEGMERFHMGFLLFQFLSSSHCCLLFSFFIFLSFVSYISYIYTITTPSLRLPTPPLLLPTRQTHSTVTLPYFFSASTLPIHSISHAPTHASPFTLGFLSTCPSIHTIYNLLASLFLITLFTNILARSLKPTIAILSLSSFSHPLAF